MGLKDDRDSFVARRVRGRQHCRNLAGQMRVVVIDIDPPPRPPVLVSPRSPRRSWRVLERSRPRSMPTELASAATTAAFATLCAPVTRVSRRRSPRPAQMKRRTAAFELDVARRATRRIARPHEDDVGARAATRRRPGSSPQTATGPLVRATDRRSPLSSASTVP